MPYALGIDLGTARTVAAVSRNLRDSWSEPVVVPLDATADRPGVASVLHFTGDDTVEVGDAVGTPRADRVARDFLDRVGDEVPLALGGRHYPAESLAAALVAWVVDRAEALEGTAATQLVVTHPVGWGAHRRAAFQAALRELSLPELTMLPRPVAAAEAYAATERLEVGDEVAVYSLGAGRFEAAVLRRGSFGFELRSHADSTDVLGGSLFDDLLAEHATADLGEVPSGALAAWRAACVAAKERLTSAVAVTIPAPPGAKKATVSVNRTDFDTLVRPVVEHTVRILQRAIAGADADALRAVVLVGGCANVPLIAELVSAAVRVRVVAADDPTTALARGAALAAGRVAKPTVQAPAVPSVTQHTDLMRFDDLSPEVPELGPPPPRPPVELAPLDPPVKGLARLTRRIRPTDDVEDEEDRPRRKRRDDDPFADSDVRPADDLDDDEQDVELLTHTGRPDRDADFLAHLRTDDPSSTDDEDVARPRTTARRHRDHPPRRDADHDDDPSGPDEDDALPENADFADRVPSHPSFPPARRPGPRYADDPGQAEHPNFPPAGHHPAPHYPGNRGADPADQAPSHPSFPPANRHAPHLDDNPAEAGHADEAPSHPNFPPVNRHEPTRHRPAVHHDDDPAELPSFPPAGRHEPTAHRPAPHHDDPAHPGRAERQNHPPTGHRPAPRYADDPGESRRADFADQAPPHPSFPPAGRHPAPHHADDPRPAELADQAPSHPSFPPAGRHEPAAHRPAPHHADDPDQPELPSRPPAGRYENTGHRPAPHFGDDPAAPGHADHPANRPAPRHDDADPRHHGRATPTGRHEPGNHRPAPRHEDHPGLADGAPGRHEERPAARHGDFPDQRAPAAHHEDPPGRRRRAEPDDETPPRHAELPGPRNRSNHAAPAGRHHETHGENWQQDEPALAQRHRRRRRDDFVDGDA